jgi:hypothetical protein
MNGMFNTKKAGTARTIIFQSGKLFKAVCLDFDIIEEANTMEKVEKQIREAIVGYIKNVCQNNLDDSLLNRHAEKRYWDIYYKYLEHINKKVEIRRSEGAKSIDLTSMFTIPISSKAYCHC